MEKVTVIIPTYNRAEILVGAVQRIQRNLIYDGPVEILVGDDSDDLKVKDSIGFHFVGDRSRPVRFVDGPKRGLGANLNMLIQEADSELILQMDDDHYLNKILDINQFAVDLMDSRTRPCLEEGTIGWIRLFLGTEEDLGNDDPFYRFTANMCERYWIPDPSFYELYIASNRPHLKSKSFHNVYGFYQEGKLLGMTETEFCHRYIDMKRLWIHEGLDSPWVVIPVAAPSFDTWKHVGDSWQKQGL